MAEMSLERRRIEEARLENERQEAEWKYECDQKKARYDAMLLEKGMIWALTFVEFKPFCSLKFL